MNNELATIIKNRIKDLPFVDKLAGLVKTIETVEKSEAGTKILRFPASAEGEGNNYIDLVPNNSRRSIFYIEETGSIKIIGGSASGVQMQSSLRLVGWVNSKLVPEPSSDIVAAILALLVDHKPFNSGSLLKIRINPAAVLSPEQGIFSKYTYEEVVKQYLMLPYFAFAIDLSATFTASACDVPVREPGALSRIVNLINGENRLLDYGEVYTVTPPAKAAIVDPLTGQYRDLSFGEIYTVEAPAKARISNQVTNESRELAYGEEYVVEAVPDELSLSFRFPIESDLFISIIALPEQVAEYKTQALDNIATVEFKRNDIVVELPFALAAGDTLLATITKANEAFAASLTIEN